MILVDRRYLLTLCVLGSFIGNGYAAFAQSGQSASSAPPPRKKPKYVTAEPKTDTSAQENPERTRLQRPEGAATALPVAPDFNKASSAGAIPPPSPSPLPMPAVESPPPMRPRDKFPTVGQLESLMFGQSNPQGLVESRLDKLEAAVFQRNYPDLDTETRISKLKSVLVGEPQQNAARQSEQPSIPAAVAPPYSGGPPGVAPAPSQPPGYARDPRPQEEAPTRPFFNNYERHNLTQELDTEQLEKFALVVINEARGDQGLEPLVWDEKAAVVARELVADLGKRGLVSHVNSKGENPDVRFHRSGGTHAMDEGLIMFSNASNLRKNRDLVAKMLEALSQRQDDRDALLSRHATHFAMAFGWSKDRSKLICATEVVTARGELDPIPLTARVGDKIEVKGRLSEQYRFAKITVAREDELPPLPDDGEESTEALPYFPPLDYAAYAQKSERDWDKGIKMLQIAGITAAIAGGLFIPPVALAAPLIAVSAGAPAVKPVSEIPVKGGVKSDGVNFSHKVPLDDNGKAGIYYVTVWAQTGDSADPIAVSRRAIIARKEDSGLDQPAESGSPASTSSAQATSDQLDGEKPEKKNKKDKKEKSAKVKKDKSGKRAGEKLNDGPQESNSDG